MAMKTNNILLLIICIGVLAAVGLLAMPRAAYFLRYVTLPQKSYYELEAKCGAYSLALAGAYEANGEHEAARNQIVIYRVMLQAYPALNKEAVDAQARQIAKAESADNIMIATQECQHTFEEAAKRIH
jgi:hypothetical protein